MEFISEEQFLKQDKEVQEVFIDWWKPSMGDLYAWNYSDESENDLHKLQACTSELVIELTNDNKGINEGNRIPILTEGQLREFIEDITGCRMLSDYNDHEGYSVWLYCKEGKLKNKYRRLGKDLLQAYWEVATKVVKESINKKGR